ncbi:hypothetical protein TCDM_07405 [Trypanosoma cruzi Dm28c]|uniref:Uncharacterized protein n=1 Tax=Trypanosoma cruzi Dm28c TaxID=1416333 RepID=V5BEM8_TRYCR|nr:hypothetical protein TCDM_07405 [Trypanosoma cruzi Dm28c]
MPRRHAAAKSSRVAHDGESRSHAAGQSVPAAAVLLSLRKEMKRAVGRVRWTSSLLSSSPHAESATTAGGPLQRPPQNAVFVAQEAYVYRCIYFNLRPEDSPTEFSHPPQSRSHLQLRLRRRLFSSFVPVPNSCLPRSPGPMNRTSRHTASGKIKMP